MKRNLLPTCNTKSLWFLSVLLFSGALEQPAIGQWDLKWHVAKPSDVQLGSSFLIGQMDDDPQKEIVWLAPEKGALRQIMIVDGNSGAPECKSDEFAVIYPGAKLEDIDEDGKSELVFMAQTSSASRVTLYVLEYSFQQFAMSSRGDIPAGETSPPPFQLPEIEKSEEPESTSPIPAMDEPVAAPPVVEERTVAIEYKVPSRGDVVIEVFSGVGTIVKTLYRGSSELGTFNILWDGKNEDGNAVPGGSYFYKVSLNGIAQERKSIFLR